jgi:hypothetical protein
MAYGNVPIGPRTAGIYFGFNYEKLTVSNTAIGLTSSAYTSGDKTAQIAFITIETNDVRYTYDGTTPTTSIGHYALAGSAITLFGTHDIQNFRVIRATGSDAAISVTYEG